jgi:uncharacterized cupin superfamily protein
MSESKPMINLAEAPMKTGGNGGKFVHNSYRLGPKLGLKTLGCGVYVVPAGKCAFPYHAHSLIEEMFYVLEGSGTLRHDGQEHPIRAGDVVASPVGKPHQIVNTSDADLKYLAISSNALADVVLYPDSNKVQAVSGAFPKTLWHVTKLSDATDYYAGEE